MRHTKNDQRIRQQLAVDAARIMSQEGISDFHIAKLKAAERAGIQQPQYMPSNIEVELALKQYQAIFRSVEQATRLNTLRTTAITIMRLLKNFSPRLVGPVLRGTADTHSVISIHLFSDNGQALDWLLLEHHIPFTISECEYRFNNNELRRQPRYLVKDDDIDVELTLFPEVGIRQAPKSPLDNRPIQRASIAEVEKLLRQV